MLWVYVIRSESSPHRRYIGLTSDVERRLAEHNSSETGHTRAYRPWTVEVVVGFANLQRARDFERYLKTGSGIAFARRHFE